MLFLRHPEEFYTCNESEPSVHLVNLFAASASHQDTCICYGEKLKKLNCNFIVPFDRFAATFVAPELFVTVALSSHCCRAMCWCMCVCGTLCVWVIPSYQPHFFFILLSWVSSKSFFQRTLNIHRCNARAVGETRPHKYNNPTGILQN